ncbi:MAG: M23 family metallopeptidase [Pseudomonadota bacterium]
MRASLVGLSVLAMAACSSTPERQGPVAPMKNLPRASADQGPFQPNLNLFVCQMQVSNRPATDAADMILNYSPMVVANGVPVASAPVNDACLSSGFGMRNGRMHKGIDLFSNPAGTIYSAAPGVILEVSELSGYGYQVLIDHGRGVYTRYAHLESFTPDTVPGARVGFGVPLGLMGRTGNATGIHLHYEVLTGDYNTPKKSWGLKPHNALALPAWTGLSGAV